MKVDLRKVRLYDQATLRGTIVFEQGRYHCESHLPDFDCEAYLRRKQAQMAEELGVEAPTPEEFFRYLVLRTSGRLAWATYAKDEGGVEINPEELRQEVWQLMARIQQRHRPVPK